MTWISVEDEPVPRMKTVLFCNKYVTAVGYIIHGKDHPTKTSCMCDSTFEAPITHWMPLPEPPEENK